jgi:serine/threonine protein kinase
MDQLGHPLPAPTAFAIGHEVLDVLAAAHGQSIIHRDIKPANVFVTRDGRVKVLDFGLARVLDSSGASAHSTQQGVPFGTPAFMAPEQALGKTREVDERADVWAVGATLFYMLSGCVVHAGETSAETLVKAATEPARPLMSVAPGTHPPLARIVDRALEFDKTRRWPSAGVMRDALAAEYRACFGEAPSPAALSPPAMRVTPPPGGPRVAPADGYDLTTAKGVSSGARRQRARRMNVGLMALAAASVMVLLVSLAFSLVREWRSHAVGVRTTDADVERVPSTTQTVAISVVEASVRPPPSASSPASVVRIEDLPAAPSVTKPHRDAVSSKPTPDSGTISNDDPLGEFRDKRH